MVSDIKLNTPDIKDQEVKDLAISYMAEEDKEYRQLEEGIPEAIKRLDKFKNDAKELIVVLSKK